MKKLLLLLSAALMFSVYTADAQNLPFVKKVVKTLTAPDMYGRGYAYNGDRIAAEYLRGVMKDLHLQPLVPDYFQTYWFDVAGMEGEVSLSVNGKPLELYTDYRVHNFSHSFDGTAPIIKFDANYLCDSAQLAAFCKKYAKKLPSSFVYLDMTSLKEMSKEESQKFSRAAYFLSYNNPFHSRGILCGVRDFSIWSFNGCQRERDYTLLFVHPQVMPEKSTELQLHVYNHFHKHQTQNICGYVKGDVEPDTMIVFTGHYDHMGQMGDNIIFYGANDNASGAAMVLDFARHYSLQKNYYTMVFLDFSGEEAGLLGSRHFTQNPPIDLSKVKFVINLDLLCSGEEGITVENTKTGIEKKYFDEMVKINAEKNYLTVLKDRANAPNSDHYSFAQQNVPAIFIYAMGKSGGIHDPSDDYDSCTFSGYEGIFRLLLDLVDRLPKM